MAALWPSLMWPPVLEAFYHAKTGVQKDFTMKHCLGEIMGGKAHKMIIQYLFNGQPHELIMGLLLEWPIQNPVCSSSAHQQSHQKVVRKCFQNQEI